ADAEALCLLCILTVVAIQPLYAKGWRLMARYVLAFYLARTHRSASGAAADVHFYRSLAYLSTFRAMQLVLKCAAADLGHSLAQWPPPLPVPPDRGGA